MPASEVLPGHLAPRASRAVKPALSYIQAFLDGQKRPWSLQDSDEGSIVMTMAENKLCNDMLQERILKLQGCPQDVLCYDDFTGKQRLREAMAQLLEDTFMKGISVSPSHLAVLTGCGAVIDNLVFCISSPGDGILIPAPYYPAFDNDLEIRCQAVPVGFTLDESLDIALQLDTAAAASKAAGHPVAALLLTNPNNPLGTIYLDATIVSCLRWCCANTVHMISDEIYGSTVFDLDTAPCVVSAEVVARREQQQQPTPTPTTPQEGVAPTGRPCLGPEVEDLLHIVWGLSKDFGASGLRVGCLHSRNALLLKAFGNLSYFAGVSGHTQHLVATLLSDRAWVMGFLEANRERMRDAYRGLTEALDVAGIPHLRAVGAMFCWVDLREALPSPDWDGEAVLWRELVEQQHLVITPGNVCHAAEPGYFRICWSWVDPAALPVAVARISKVLEAQRTICSGQQGLRQTL
ncbi:MAG: hypothetical protein WDW38_007421 [Sanguina aurantia]